MVQVYIAQGRWISSIFHWDSASTASTDTPHPLTAPFHPTTATSNPFPSSSKLLNQYLLQCVSTSPMTCTERLWPSCWWTGSAHFWSTLYSSQQWQSTCSAGSPKGLGFLPCLFSLAQEQVSALGLLQRFIYCISYTSNYHSIWIILIWVVPIPNSVAFSFFPSSDC